MNDANEYKRATAGRRARRPGRTRMPRTAPRSTMEGKRALGPRSAPGGARQPVPPGAGTSHPPGEIRYGETANGTGAAGAVPRA